MKKLRDTFPEIFDEIEVLRSTVMTQIKEVIAEETKRDFEGLSEEERQMDLKTARERVTAKLDES